MLLRLLQNLGVCISLAGVFLVMGCSSQDFGGSFSSIGDMMDSGKPYVEEDEELEAQQRAARLAEVLQAWEEKSATEKDFYVGPDDVLKLGVVSLENPGETTVLLRTVTKDGLISMPLVGDLAVAGLSTRDIRTRIVEAYSEKYLKDPQATVEIAEYRSAPVVITGAVQNPGMYYLRHNSSSVLEVLSMAEGLSTAAGRDLLIVRPTGESNQTPPKEGDAISEADPAQLQSKPVEKENAAETVGSGAIVAAPPSGGGEGKAEPTARQSVWSRIMPFGRNESGVDAVPGQTEQAAGKASADAAADPGNTLADAPAEDYEPVEEASPQKTITVDLTRLLTDGDIRMNVPIYAGDVLTVPPRKNQYVYVLGYVNSPGSFEVSAKGNVRALHAVAMAGGLSPTARAQNSFLITERRGIREVIHVDLTKITRGIRPPVYMEAGDTLVIGSGVLAKLGEFVKPSVGASASLSPVP